MMKKTLIALLTTVALSTSACAAEEQSSVATPVKSAAASVKSGFNAPAEAWRELDPENTLYIDLEYGRVVLELYPEIAPLHVAQIKTLARQTFYDGITFHLSLIHISEPTRPY